MPSAEVRSAAHAVRPALRLQTHDEPGARALHLMPEAADSSEHVGKRIQEGLEGR
jgi:hypothetical protein